MEKKICIAWIYDNLLDLYGDSGNITYLNSRLIEMGFDSEIQPFSIGDEFDFTNCDMLYFGPGKMSNLIAASINAIANKEKILNAIEEGKLVLSVGNSRLMFGRQFFDLNGTRYDGLGLFEYIGYDDEEVFVCDAVGKSEFFGDENTYGFINRTSYIHGNDKDNLFKLTIGTGDDNINSEIEGNHYKNFFGTWFLGPVVVKNPHIAREFLKILAKEDFKEYDDSLEAQALKFTLNELI